MEKIKNILSAIKNWIVSNGIEGALGLVLGIILWIAGYKIWAGVSFGVFAHTRTGTLLKLGLIKIYE